MNPQFYPITGPMPVCLNVDNRGNIDASVNLIVTVTNANITSSDMHWIEYNGTQAIIPLIVQSHQGYGAVTINVLPNSNAQYFTITYSVVDVHDWSIPNGLIDHIGRIELNGYSPLIATYNETSPGAYQLLG